MHAAWMSPSNAVGSFLSDGNLSSHRADAIPEVGHSTQDA